MTRDLVGTKRTHSGAETEAFGAALGARLRRGACVCLAGPLGAGKTVLVAGLCRGLGVRDPVTSPTFILMESFAGRLPVVHIDLYRLQHEREIEELGIFDLLGGDTVVIAEWGERSPSLHAAADLDIRIEPEDGDTRAIRVHATPSFARELDGVEW